MRSETQLDPVATSRRILKSYDLCDSCLGRQLPFYRRQLSNTERGRLLRAKVLKGAPDPKSCYICQGLMASIASMAQKATQALRRFQYQTFQVGASIPPVILEREDRLRAELKLRGAETLKSEVSKEIATRATRRTGKTISHQDADVTVLADFLTNTATIRSRALYLFGRYLKKVRGLDQKRRPCPSCKGRGCADCNLTGVKPGDTVESILTKKLLRAFKATKAKFSWVGGEDRDSLVLGRGRPFYAEIREPRIRQLVRPLSPRRERGVVLNELRLITREAPRPHEFTATFRVILEFDREVPPSTLKQLEAAFANREVRVISSKKHRILTKRIHELKIEESEARQATIMLKCDGGLNIKKFVSGSPIATPEGEVPEVAPNLSDTLGARARCILFDVLDVELSFAGRSYEVAATSVK